MNSGFGYNQPKPSSKNFDCLRTVCNWAGYFGLAQALAWIGLAITAIVADNCGITIDDTFNYSTVIPTIFKALYFSGNCASDDLPTYANFINVDTVLSWEGLLIWCCVYLGVAICWLVASGLIIVYVRRDNHVLTASVILSWAVVTLFICGMDLALGIIFGIDYGNFKEAAAKENLSSVNAGAIDPQAVQLVAAMVASISMMIMAFKGFVLYLINAGLMVYLSIRAIMLLKHNDTMDTVFISSNESVDIMTTQAPIDAYNENKKPEMMSTVFSNEAFVADEPPQTNGYGINQDVLNRAARMSMDTSLNDRRFRNLDSFQQYPAKPNRPESVIMENNSPPVVVAAFPAPDYTPPMQRANRNQRYQ